MENCQVIITKEGQEIMCAEESVTTYQCVVVVDEIERVETIKVCANHKRHFEELKQKRGY